MSLSIASSLSSSSILITVFFFFLSFSSLLTCRGEGAVASKECEADEKKEENETGKTERRYRDDYHGCKRKQKERGCDRVRRTG